MLDGGGQGRVGEGRGGEGKGEKRMAAHWPYIVTARQRGWSMDSVLPLLTPSDSLAIAEFLGDALRELHALPLPQPEWLAKGFLKHHLNPPEEPPAPQTPQALQGPAQGDAPTPPHKDAPVAAPPSGAGAVPVTGADSGAGTVPVPGPVPAPGAKTGAGAGADSGAGAGQAKAGQAGGLPSSAPLSIPTEWETFVGLLRERRADCVMHLDAVGSLPQHLLKQVDDYLPKDPACLLAPPQAALAEGGSGVQPGAGAGAGGRGGCVGEGAEGGGAGEWPRATWLHTDVMTDNLLLEASTPEADTKVKQWIQEHSRTTAPATPTPSPSAKGGHEGPAPVAGGPKGEGGAPGERLLSPSSMIDFGELLVGDPLYDFVMLYVSVLRSKPGLLRACLARYGGHAQLAPPSTAPLSYRAMCYTLLHSNDALLRVLKEKPELKDAARLEDVQRQLWGCLDEPLGAPGPA